ncbi:hypothetical protein ACJX0J_039889, partial [Zea mays]
MQLCVLGGASNSNVLLIHLWKKLARDSRNIVLPLCCFLHCIFKLSSIIICVVITLNSCYNMFRMRSPSLETVSRRVTIPSSEQALFNHAHSDVHFDTLASDETYVDGDMGASTSDVVDYKGMGGVTDNVYYIIIWLKIY